MRDEQLKLPSYAPEVSDGLPRRKFSRGLRIVLAVTLSLAALQYAHLYSGLLTHESLKSVQVPLRASEWLDKCELLNAKPGPPPDFHTRAVSDRFVPGTKATLITVRSIAIYIRPHKYSL